MRFEKTKVNLDTIFPSKQQPSNRCCLPVCNEIYILSALRNVPWVSIFVSRIDRCTQSSKLAPYPSPEITTELNVYSSFNVYAFHKEQHSITIMNFNLQAANQGLRLLCNVWKSVLLLNARQWNTVKTIHYLCISILYLLSAFWFETYNAYLCLPLLHIRIPWTSTKSTLGCIVKCLSGFIIKLTVISTFEPKPSSLYKVSHTSRSS